MPFAHRLPFITVSRFVLLLALLFVAQYMSGQGDRLSIVVTQKSTNEPIENAFVFLENTTIGAYTDQDGRAELSYELTADQALIVTHLLYKDQSRKIEASPGEISIRLEEKSYDLENVFISAKKSNSKKYKRWMKRFQAAFLGDKKIRRKVQIMNPEVMWFEESDSLLTAHAIDNIKVRNNLTGYEMQIALDHFSLSQEDDVIYKGKIFFDDILDDARKPEKLNKSRMAIYRWSSQLFFRSLIEQHPSNLEEFEYGITSRDSSGRLVYDRKEYDHLNWKLGPQADTLLVSNYLTVRVKDKLVKAFKANRIRLVEGNHQKAIGTSFLYSKSGRFIISHDGHVLNQGDIEVSGEWASDRIAHEQPRNYTGDVIFNDRTSIEIVDHLLAYPSAYQPEKVYLHTDKSVYLPFENLWFKGYLVNGVDHSHQTQSQVVYVNLLDEEGESVNNWILHTSQGLLGDMQWTADYPTGDYTLRAYTSHMHNQGGEFIFEKKIKLSSLSGEDIAKGIHEDIDVSFYPESGDLIAGISSQVTFMAKYADGTAAMISGVIRNSSGEMIANCQTVHRGIGVFTITPVSGETYFLEVPQLDSDQRFPLPQSINSGLSLRVNSTEDQNIFIEVLSSDAALLDNAFLIGHARGGIFTFVNRISEERSIQLDKRFIPDGLLHFTIFDRNERPHAERLVFNDWQFEKGLISDFEISEEPEILDIVMVLDSSVAYKGLDISASVVDAVFYPSALSERDIKTYLLVDSDLNKQISGLSYYLRDIDKTKRYYLDLLLRSLAWRRFTWRDIVEPMVEPEFKIESGYSIQGYTSEKDEDTRTSSTVLITALGAELVQEYSKTDLSGTYSFDNLSYMDSVTYVIQARKRHKELDDGTIELFGDRLIDIYASAKSEIVPNGIRKSLLIGPQKETYKKKDLDFLRQTYLELQYADSSLWSIDAPEVEIVSRKSHTTNLPIPFKYIDMDNAPWIAQEAGGTNLLSLIAPQYRFHLGAGGQLMSSFINRYGEPVVVPSQVIIDGIGGEPGGSTNAPRLYGLTADRIKSIAVGKGFVSIVTRNIPRSVEKSLESGVMHIAHPGYYKAREFSTEIAPLPDENLSTLLWEPQVKVDEHGRIVLGIPKKEVEDGYVVVLEGLSDEGDIISFRTVKRMLKTD